MSTWPFSDPPNVATFTVKQILDKTSPILLVYHDDEDGGWQFLTGQALDMNDARLVSLKEIYVIDKSIAEIANLPLGWQATRANAHSSWLKVKIEST